MKTKVKNNTARFCWEFWSCPKEAKNDCRIYNNNYGEKCWEMAGYIPQAKRKFDSCWNCPWYLGRSKRCFLGKNKKGRKK